ncbi:MAG: NAD(P)H-hydrate dehydratase [Beutenbergiaceae bacterium]
MQAAAHEVAQVVAQVVATVPTDQPTVLVLVGGGNNGGDGLFAAAELAAHTHVVVALAAAPHTDGFAAAKAAGVDVVDMQHAGAFEHLATVAESAQVWVDALTGLGARGALRGTVARVVQTLTSVAADARVVAVDIPSGVDSDTGAAAGPVLKADITVTFGAPKAGLLLPPGANLTGRVHVAGLGIDEHLDPTQALVTRLTETDVTALWPIPGRTAHKYSRGVVALVAGSSTYPGAAVLAAGAAVRTGCGMVRYLGPRRPTDLVLSAWPEVVPVAGRAQAWVVGPGLDPQDLDQRDQAGQAISTALADAIPLVIDAGGLTLVPEADQLTERPVLLTPHAGELAALLSQRGEQLSREQVEAEPTRWAVHAAAITGATVLLKGAVTVVAGAGECYSQDDGTPWLATAGSGDVLAGILGALLAQIATAQTSIARVAALAVLVHGRAGRRASIAGPIGASDLLPALPAVITDLVGAGRLAP